MAFSLVSIISLLSTSEKKANKMIESVILKAYSCNKMDWRFGNISNRGVHFCARIRPLCLPGSFCALWYHFIPDIPNDFEQFNAMAHGLISPLTLNSWTLQCCTAAVVRRHTAWYPHCPKLAPWGLPGLLQLAKTDPQAVQEAPPVHHQLYKDIVKGI